MGRSDDDLRAAISAVVATASAELGLDLEDVVVRRGRGGGLVRVVVDRDGGVDSGVVAELSRSLSGRMDVFDDDFVGEYTLEVTSRGAAAPLTLPRHFRRAVGRLVSATLRSGDTRLVRIAAADDANLVVFDGADGVTPEALALADIASASVEIEFAAPAVPVREALARVGGTTPGSDARATQGEGTA